MNPPEYWTPRGRSFAWMFTEAFIKSFTEAFVRSISIKFFHEIDMHMLIGCRSLRERQKPSGHLVGCPERPYCVNLGQIATQSVRKRQWWKTRKSSAMSLYELEPPRKSGEKNLPSYDRKTRASRAKKLGIWPKRAPTMWAPRTLLWWPPCDLGHWSYEPRCRSLHAAGHGHSHGHRNLSSQTHCTTPAARAQHTFSNWVFVALLPLHTSCQIHP